MKRIKINERTISKIVRRTINEMIEQNDPVKKAVVGQIIGMFDNNILQGGGNEGFMGWIEDGDAYYNNGMEGDALERAIELSSQIAPYVDKITSILATN